MSTESKISGKRIVACIIFGLIGLVVFSFLSELKHQDVVPLLIILGVVLGPLGAAIVFYSRRDAKRDAAAKLQGFNKDFEVDDILVDKTNRKVFFRDANRIVDIDAIKEWTLEWESKGKSVRHYISFRMSDFNFPSHRSFVGAFPATAQKKFAQISMLLKGEA